MSREPHHSAPEHRGPPAGTSPTDPLFTIVRAILFNIDPERAHDLALAALSRCATQDWLFRRYRAHSKPVQQFGLSFANRVGLAAGLDKNGDHIDALGALGFGFLELGTVTPRPQSGNVRPRIFRLPAQGALINRLGFNNKGVDHLVAQVQKASYPGVIGINIGKNASTPLENAADDYLHCLERVYPLADYVTLNLSSPNTEGLRKLQHGDALRQLLDAIRNRQSSLSTEHSRRVPLLIKLAPDMTPLQLHTVCDVALEFGIEGVIGTNTSQARAGVEHHIHARETGGLSGGPIRALADQRLAQISERLAGRASLIGVGGIASGADAARKRVLGADLVQIYTGFIYHGPALVRDCIRSTQ